MKWLHRLILAILALTVLASVVYVIYSAGSYYMTPQLERPYSDLHQQWKPGGIMGHGLGVIGSLMILIMLGYSLRKRIRVMRNWGQLSSWLNYHIFLGIFGPILIIFHTSFKFHGLVSISFWSMIAVALSGFAGRYIYVQIPRKRDGMELSLNEIEATNQDMITTLQEDYGLTNQDIISLEESINPAGKMPGLWFFLIFYPYYFIIVRLRLKTQLKKFRQHHSLSSDQRKGLYQLMRQKVVLSRRINLLDQSQRIFHLWHIVHRPFAYVMIFIMFLHVGVAVYMGLTWIF